MHRVVAVAIPDVILFDLAIPAEVFGRQVERDRYAFEVCTECPGAVSCTSGVDVHVPRGLRALDAADTVIVPGFHPRETSAAVVRALRRAADRGARVASVCVGAFALAAAGLLDGRAATTHWECADELAERFPRVRVRPEVLYIDEGQVLTSAGIAAGIDLCLHLVRTDHRPGGQAQFMHRPIPAVGPGLADTCAWALKQMHRPITVADLASRAGYSARTFARRFVDETGTTPLRWLTAQRLLEARRLLEASDVSVEEVAQRTGLGTTANLRLHLAREVGTTPTAYRSAFRGPTPMIPEAISA
jgi:transcriptional regulator GlxA family with amidase domain